MRDLLDLHGSRESLREEHEEFTRSVLDRLFEIKELTELDHIDILRQLEINSLQMIDDYYADMQNDDNFDEGQENNLNLDERMFEFQRSINRIREAYRQRRQEEKNRPNKSSPEDVTMKEEPEESKKSSSSGEKELKPAGSDVDMTDEEEEE
jgi:hypothetical protein